MSGGYRKYLSNILPRLLSNQSIGKIICTLPSGVRIDDIPNRKGNIDLINVAPIRILNKSTLSQLNGMLHDFNPDVVYVPVERLFAYERAAVVTMVQNMEPFVCPFSGNPPFEIIKNLFRAFNARRALSRAERIIAISKFVRQYLIEKLRIKSEKICLVYHGNGTPNSCSEKPIFIPENCDRFLFTAGSIRPARGLEDVFEALMHLANESLKIPLIIAGNVDPCMAQYKRRLQAYLDRYDLSKAVIWAGDISEQNMNWCYRNCSAFVMTSRVESFGFIALEAMSNGSLCISTDSQCLPEIFGDAAVYYRAGDGKGLSGCIMGVLSWDQTSKMLAAKRATERASQFSWDVCANRTVEELRVAMRDFAEIGRARH